MRRAWIQFDWILPSCHGGSHPSLSLAVDGFFFELMVEQLPRRHQFQPFLQVESVPTTPYNRLFEILTHASKTGFECLTTLPRTRIKLLSIFQPISLDRGWHNPRLADITVLLEQMAQKQPVFNEKQQLQQLRTKDPQAWWSTNTNQFLILYKFTAIKNDTNSC